MVSIKELNERLEKLQEEDLKVMEKRESADGDDLIIKANKDSQFYPIVIKLLTACNKGIEEIKLLHETEELQLFEIRTSGFRDLQLFLYNKKEDSVKRISPKQALSLFIDKEQKICKISNGFGDYIYDENGNHVKKSNGGYKYTHYKIITFE